MERPLGAPAPAASSSLITSLYFSGVKPPCTKSIPNATRTSGCRYSCDEQSQILVTSMLWTRRVSACPPRPRRARVGALPQPRQHVPGDLFDLRVSSCQPVSPIGRPRRHHCRARLVGVRTQDRVSVPDAFHRLGLTRPEHA